MMVEKERGVLDSATVHTIWQATSNGYRHVVTGARERDPHPVLGGVLADVSELAGNVKMTQAGSSARSRKWGSGRPSQHLL